MIDFHTHPVQIADLYDSDPTFTYAVRDVFGLYMKPQPIETYFRQLDEAGIERAVLLPIDCTTAHGCTIVSNAQVAALMERSERLIGFASVDPGQPDAAEKLARDVSAYGLSGLKLDPALQQFALDDEQRAWPIYATAQELSLPVLVHCGLSWAKVGRAASAHPLALESVVHAFPNLRLVIAHLGWPWVTEAVMLAVKHRSVHLDTSVLFSGTPSDALRHVVNNVIGRELFDRSLPDQIVFGSNYPRVDPKRAVWAIRELGLRPRLEQRIFNDNAVALLTPNAEVAR